MQFEYPLLEALAAVVREGTFEAAARSLNITQSAVSQRIRLLEERSGAILIARGRPCVATEYGQQLYRHVEQVQLLEHGVHVSRFEPRVEKIRNVGLHRCIPITQIIEGITQCGFAGGKLAN